MCAILDANSIHEVFGNTRSEAGKDFYRWISRGGTPLVAGGKLLEELNVNSNFQQWYGQAVGRRLAISTTAENDIDIESIIEDLTQQDIYASDDYHILALAKVTGARLLYTQDKKLRSDFKEIVKGRVYPSGNSKNAKRNRNRIHNERNLCVTPLG